MQSFLVLCAFTGGATATLNLFQKLGSILAHLPDPRFAASVA